MRECTRKRKDTTTDKEGRSLEMEYYIALENFLSKMAELKEIEPETIADAVGELCGLLRISKISAVFYDSLKHEAQNKGTSLICFDNGKGDRVAHTDRIVTNGMTVAHTRVYQSEEDEPWSDTEREKVEFIQKMMSIFLGRIRLMRVAEKYTYYDDEGYYNLRYFLRHIDRMAMQGALGGNAAMHFNLKHFAAINQQIGRNLGTFVMRGFIEGLRELIGDEGIVCRVGGDNFVAIMPEEKVKASVSYLSGTRVVYDNTSGGKVPVSASVGVFVMPKNFHYEDASDVMDKIMSASQAARSNGKQEVVFFDTNMIANKEKMTRIQQLFPQAMENEEFLVYYQPKVSIGGGSLAGAEALCRWLHNGEIISPAEFIPVLEMGMDICKLDFYMLDHVCRDIRRWLDEGKKVVRISVNLSRKHMMDMDLLDRIIEIIDRHNVPHEYLEIELTETTTDVEFRDLKRVVRGLQEAGVSTSVDDFGIGYSSLNLIKEIPWNVLKVDRSFLPIEEDNDTSPRSVMFKYVVAMARELGLECIAEGVETKEQVGILKDNNCDMAQGFYFDKPLPVGEFEERLNSYKYQAI